MKLIVGIAATAALGLLPMAAQAQQPKLIQGGEEGVFTRYYSDAYVVAAGDPECAPEAELEPGICFDDAIDFMSDYGLRSTLVIGSTAMGDTISPMALAISGAIFRLSSGADGFEVERLTKSELRISRSCGRIEGEAIKHQWSSDTRVRALVSTALVVCDGGIPTSFRGAPQAQQTVPEYEPQAGVRVNVGGSTVPFSQAPFAEEAVFIYEFYGDQTLLVYPQNCLPEDRLFDGACFSQVKSFMQQRGITDQNVIKADGNYQIGSRLSFSNQADVIKVLTNRNYDNWKARHAHTFDSGVRYPGGCRNIQDRNDSGVIVTGSGMVQFYKWMACPQLTFR